jgi:2-polyprenyl-3-methyl-5-hydroxy-6-metoxy-1,4-benzoquinol methylase
MRTKSSAGPVMNCQICGHSPLIGILWLGHQPILQEYLTKEKLQQPEATYPLNLVYCKKCGLSQLDYIIDQKLVFMPQYPYRTGLTNMLVRNFAALAEKMRAAGYYKKGDLVVDIGSNDGTLLKQFKNHGAKVVGVEPTNVAKVAIKNNIPTLQHYFNADTVKQILKKNGKPRVITATNVFAHINDVPALIQNIKSLMGKDSVFVSESQYFRDMIEKLAFDTIYNEHLRYYGLKPMAYMFGMHGMSVVDAERIEAGGGSIRVYAKTGNHPMSPRAKKLLAEEKKLGLYNIKTLKEFAKRTYDVKHELLELLTKIKRTGARIVGITSSGRSNALLGFTKINYTFLDYNGEKKGSPKIGMFTPGTYIEVVDESRILKDQPEYAVVLSWHLEDELIEIMRAGGYKGTFIVPLSKPRIVKNNEAGRD